MTCWHQYILGTLMRPLSADIWTDLLRTGTPPPTSAANDAIDEVYVSVGGTLSSCPVIIINHDNYFVPHLFILKNRRSIASFVFYCVL